MTVLYLAGPITGIADHNFPAFAAAAQRLRAAGHRVRDPSAHGVDPNMDWADYVYRGLHELLSCEAVAVLDGWQHSRGAQLEVHVARELGMDVAPVGVWLKDAADLAGLG